MTCELQPGLGYSIEFRGARLESEEDSAPKLTRRRWEQEFEDWDASWNNLSLSGFQTLWGIVRACQSSRLVQWKPPRFSEYGLFLIRDAGWSSSSWQRYRVSLTLSRVRGVAPDSGQTAPILEFVAP